MAILLAEPRDSAIVGASTRIESHSWRVPSGSWHLAGHLHIRNLVPGRNPGASLSSSVVGRRGLSGRLALDYQRCRARYKPRRCAQRAAFLASACLGRLSVIVGVLLLRHPGEGLLTLTLLLIVFFIVEGISKVIFSLTVRPFPNWGWVLASGIVGILLALYLWANLPITAVWLLGVLLGIQLICEGAALGYLAWKVRTS